MWLYSNQGSLSYRMSDLCRKLTTRLPQRLLYALCHFAGPLGAVDALLRRLGLTWLAKLLHLAVPYSTHPRWHWRVLDTFDWYSPRYQSKHSKEELLAWFESEGLIHNRVLEVLVSVQGQRPEAQNP